MKNKLLGLTALAISSFGLITSANAALTTNGGSLGGDAIKLQEGGYNADLHLRQATFTIKVDKDMINNVISQSPGYDAHTGSANLGLFYVSLDPSSYITKGETDTIDIYSGWTTDSCDVECTMAEVKGLADNQYTKAEASQDNVTHDPYLTVWALGVEIKYKDENGDWQPIPDEGNGQKAIKTVIKDKTNSEAEITDEDYGEKFIFSVPERDNIWVWRITEQANTNNPKYEYIQISYDIEFPITASNGKDSYYYLTLEDAIEEAAEVGIKEITINDNIDVEEDVTIPKNMKINVASGSQLNFKKNVTFEPGATIAGEGDVTYASESTVQYAVSTEVTNGTASVDKTSVKAGEKVKVTYSANAGYEFASLKITYMENGVEKELTLDPDGTFTMPAGNVVVKVTFVKIEEPSKDDEPDEDKPADKEDENKPNGEEDNKPSTDKDTDKDNELEEAPSTLDNIFTYIALGATSLASTGVVIKKKLK